VRLIRFWFSRKEMRELAVVIGNNLDTGFFNEPELVGLVRAAGTEKSLPLGGPCNVLNVGSVTVGEWGLLQNVLLVAVRTLYGKSGGRHACFLLSLSRGLWLRHAKSTPERSADGAPSNNLAVSQARIGNRSKISSQLACFTNVPCGTFCKSASRHRP